MTRLLHGLFILLFCSCAESQSLRVGAERMTEYLPLLEGKRVGLIVNQTSGVGDTHLVDTLLSKGIEVVKVFAPEHGFRGEAPDGATIDNTTDPRTGLPIVSIYGKNKKPTEEMLADVDVLVFDIQDVGVRFYTFISTMHYAMEAAAEQGKAIIVLDRPNPNGMYVAGPVKDEEVSSFVGMHPIPIVHGLTVGELAKMINGEGWLAGGLNADLTVVPVQGYDHTQTYELPVPPSPNLPTANAIALYPSLALFEGTVVSVGRGTDYPFEVIGHPDYVPGTFTFTPQPNAGSQYPPLEGELCKGADLRKAEPTYAFTLKYLINYYRALQDQTEFFKPYLTLLAGTTTLAEQIKAGMTEAEIKASWEPRLEKYRSLRKQYLLYPDFH